jgi:Ca-activated chloride channel family protein
MRADFSLDYDVLTVERPQKLYMLARLVSGPAPSDQQRRPLNLSLVIDRSGSMSGDKIDYTRQAAQFLVQNLGARDIFSIVLYNDKVEILFTPEAVANKDLLNQRIASVKAGGTTNLSGGWLEGCRLVGEQLEDSRLNRVILMSDGLANRGVTEVDKLVAMAQQKRGERITTTTMGLGKDFNEDLLIAMADAGGGAYYFIESPEVAPTIFHEELQGLLSVVGQNLAITIDPTEHVTIINQLNAYPMHTNGRQVSFRLGDVFGDEEKTLLLELNIPALLEIGQRQIATLRFEYDELTPDGSQHRLMEMPVIVNITAQGQEPQLANPQVQQSVLLLKAAQARREAVKAADRGEYNAASQILRDVAQAIKEAGLDNEQLTEEHTALLQQATDMEQGAAKYNEYSRKTMSTQAFYSMTSRHEDTVVLRMRERQRQPEQTEAKGDIAASTKPKNDVTPTHVTWNGKTFPLSGDLIRIGRAPHNEIIIEARGVSRFHCQIKREGDQLWLEDIGSTNGTFVDGRALSGLYNLRVGDEVMLCDEKLVFHTEEKSE